MTVPSAVTSYIYPYIYCYDLKRVIRKILESSKKQPAMFQCQIS